MDVYAIVETWSLAVREVNRMWAIESSVRRRTAETEKGAK
jgi:hypothetical protein